MKRIQAAEMGDGRHGAHAVRAVRESAWGLPEASVFDSLSRVSGYQRLQDLLILTHRGNGMKLEFDERNVLL